MRRARPCLVLLASLLAVACGQEAGGRAAGGVSSGGKGDNTEEDSSDGGGTDQPLSDHRDATMKCEAIATHLRDHLNPSRTDAIVDLERDRNDCLVRADDAAEPVIEAKLSAAGDPYMGQTSRVFRSHRDQAVAACNAVVEAHADAGGKALAGIATACIAGVELHLALVLDAYVDFGVAPFSIRPERDRYPGCYEGLDAALAAAPEDEAAAHAALAECITAEQDALLGELAARVVVTFPGRDVTDVENELHDTLLSLRETRGTLCAISVHAGPAMATGDAELGIAECEVDAALQLGEMIRWAAPDLLEEGTASDDGSSSGEDSGTTDAAESSSTDDGSGSDSTGA